MTICKIESSNLGINCRTYNSFNGSLFPSWTPNPYTLTFNANGGYCSESSRIVYHGGQYGTLPNATRPGFSFAGWFTSPNSGVQIHDYNTVMAQSWTCYAHWTQTDFTAPTLSRRNVTAVTVVGGGTPYFSVTYNASDDSAGVNSYYWGTSAPTASSAWNSWSGGNISVSINLSRTQNYVQQGTYYFGVRDNCGNINYTSFKWLMTWYDASTGWGIQIPTGGLNYYNCGENHWGTIWIKDESRSTKIAEFQANGGNSGTLDGNTSVWIGWEAFAFAAWN